MYSVFISGRLFLYLFIVFVRLGKLLLIVLLSLFWVSRFGFLDRVWMGMWVRSELRGLNFWGRVMIGFIWGRKFFVVDIMKVGRDLFLGWVFLRILKFGVVLSEFMMIGEIKDVVMI